MKTTEVTATSLSENGINARLNHKTFLEFSAKTPYAKVRKNVRKVDKAGSSLYAMLGIEDFTAQNRVTIHPEFLAFTYQLYGVSRKLILYIIFYEMNNDNCCFIMDFEMIKRFRQFSALLGEMEESDKAIIQATRSLVRKNTMVLVGGKEYMLNPLIAGGANENRRRKMIDAYSFILKRKGMDIAIDFYPRYLASL